VKIQGVRTIALINVWNIMIIMEVHVQITVLLEIVEEYVPWVCVLKIVEMDAIIDVGHCLLIVVVVVKKKKERLHWPLRLC